jgi:UDP-3-O-[3-hydroxymyristoyl] N-acetylglucosamine deacetylase
MGLHSGARCSVVLERRPGPLLFQIAGHEASLADLSVTRTDHGVTVRSRRGGGEIDLVEHLFAAFAGLSIRSGVTTTLSGPEVPLLDGGAAELSRALLALGPPRQGPPLLVAERGSVEVDGARYTFEPGPSVEVEVEVDFERGGIGRQSATFAGNATRFLDEIAPARTFGFAADADALRARGRARFVDPHSVIVLDEEGRALPPGRPPRPGELARHKLLDLLGDLFAHGGPPRGRVHAVRPGHRATHRALAQALERGFLLRR